MISDPSEPLSPRPWGLWPTLGFSLLIFLLFLGIQTLVASLIVVQRFRLDPGIDPVRLAEDLATDGSVIALATVVSAPLCIGATLGFAALRRQGSAWDYLQLRVPEQRQLGLWLGITLVVVVAMDTIKSLLGIEIVPPFSIQIYTTANPLVLLYLAVVGLAPLFEEVMFRGFLFQGLRTSWLGSAGAILVTSLIWAGIHSQYDLTNILSIVCFGVLLGISQLRTHCLTIPIAMHALNNLIALIQAAWRIHLLN